MAVNHQHQHGRVEARGINKINWDALELEKKSVKHLNKINWDALELDKSSGVKHLNKINWDALEVDKKAPVKHLNKINWDALEVDNKMRFIHNKPDLALLNKAVSVETVYSQVYVTESKTFAGPAQYVTVTSDSTNTGAHAKSTSLNAAEASYASAKSAANHPVAASSSSPAKTTASQAASSYQTTPPQFTRTGNNGIKGSPHTTSRTNTANVVGGTPLSASHSASANLTSQKSSGMSGGAKAGLAFGVLAIIAVVGGLIFFCWRRRKQQLDRNGAEKLDEKHASTTSFFSGTAAAVGAPAGEIRQNNLRASHTAATAPRLSLRPVTQFLPNILGGGNNNNAQSTRDGPQMSEKSKSGWDRTPAGATQNPFDDAAVLDEKNTRPVSPLNPFEEGDGTVVAGAKKSPSHSQKNSWEGSEPPTPKSTKFGTAAAVPISAAAAASGPKGPAGPNNVHRVQLDFKPSMDDELELRSGQLVRMLHEYDDGWVSSAFNKHSFTTMLMFHSASACAWTAPNKASAPVPASPNSPSSPVPKAHHPTATAPKPDPAAPHRQVCRAPSPRQCETTWSRAP